MNGIRSKRFAVAQLDGWLDRQNKVERRRGDSLATDLDRVAGYMESACLYSCLPGWERGTFEAPSSSSGLTRSTPALAWFLAASMEVTPLYCVTVKRLTRTVLMLYAVRTPLHAYVPRGRAQRGTSRKVSVPGRGVNLV